MLGPHENWFLVDPKDKDEYNKLLTRLGGNTVISLIIALVAVVASSVALTAVLGDNTLWVNCAVTAAWFVYYFVIVLKNHAQKKLLLSRNEAKFRDNELDNLRRGLQREYYLYQRRANITMLAIMAGCTLAAFIFAVCTADYSEPGWGAYIWQITGFALFLSIIIALAVCIIMAIVYGRKVRHGEKLVCDILSAQYEAAYYKAHPEDKEEN